VHQLDLVASVEAGEREIKLEVSEADLLLLTAQLLDDPLGA
jgi:hypothetical protein